MHDFEDLCLAYDLAGKRPYCDVALVKGGSLIDNLVIKQCRKCNCLSVRRQKDEAWRTMFALDGVTMDAEPKCRS